MSISEERYCMLICFLPEELIIKMSTNGQNFEMYAKMISSQQNMIFQGSQPC
ncbi:hypothetical protein HanPSC8_Chr09g0376461 [Helianthus annuus]|nr:hypothetical protein HanPSC8_Chr09g0376461 [Helianthus annuus]